jgi:hypothetical protein
MWGWGGGPPPPPACTVPPLAVDLFSVDSMIKSVISGCGEVHGKGPVEETRSNLHNAW